MAIPTLKDVKKNKQVAKPVKKQIAENNIAKQKPVSKKNILTKIVDFFLKDNIKTKK